MERKRYLRLDILPPDDLWLSKLDEWIRREGGSPIPTRAAAIRRMVEERIELDSLVKRERKAAKR